MAKPSKTKSETTVTRIKASDSDTSSKDVKPTKVAAKKITADKKPKSEKANDTTRIKEPGRGNVFVRMWTYFKGAWTELRLVRWPDRKATWGMTGALLAFTIFFVVIILVLDYGFSELFKLILGTN